MDDRVLYGWLIGLIMGAILSGFMHSKFEAEACTKLEQRTGQNMAFTYGTGCVLAEDL